jgi:hypothetical protein
MVITTVKHVIINKNRTSQSSKINIHIMILLKILNASKRFKITQRKANKKNVSFPVVQGDKQ